MAYDDKIPLFRGIDFPVDSRASLARSRMRIPGAALGGMIVAGCLLGFEARTCASSHNDVTDWAKFFGPHPLDFGGDLPGYVNAVASANESGSLVVIEGTCASACTVKLAARNRCVKPDAILWFHAAVDGSTISPIANELLLDTYPPRVREEVLRRHMLNDIALNPEHTLTGAELIGLGERACR